MVYAVQVNVAFRNAARRNAAASAVEGRLDDFERWGPTEVLVQGREANALMVEVRFVNEADRDTFWVELETFMGDGINGPVAGSQATLHDCPHDEAADDSVCVVGESRTW